MTGPVILVVGARPNFMKIAPIHAELARRGIAQILLHTGQHYDENMSKVFFDDLGMPHNRTSILELVAAVMPPRLRKSWLNLRRSATNTNLAWSSW